jgi:glycosyltransferase involved in cell wall biosynthesis
MIQGIPVVGSDSVTFSSEIVKYSDVNEMYEAMKKILESPEIYKCYSRTARQKAMAVQNQNKNDAIATIRRMIGNL